MLIEGILWLGIVGVACLVLGVGGLIADYVLPMIRPLRRWIRDRAKEMER